MEEADLIVETPKDTKNAAIIHPKWKKTGHSPYRQRYEEFQEDIRITKNVEGPILCKYSC